MPVSYLLSIDQPISYPSDKVRTLTLILTSYTILGKYLKLHMLSFSHLCAGVIRAWSPKEPTDRPRKETPFLQQYFWF